MNAAAEQSAPAEGLPRVAYFHALERMELEKTIVDSDERAILASRFSALMEGASIAQLTGTLPPGTPISAEEYVLTVTAGMWTFFTAGVRAAAEIVDRREAAQR